MSTKANRAAHQRAKDRLRRDGPRVKPCCPRCRHPGYWRVPLTFSRKRPGFQCDKCGNYWTFGVSGVPYVGVEMGERDYVQQNANK